MKKRTVRVSNMSETFEYSTNKSGDRLDLFVSRMSNISRSYAQKVISCGDVTVNGHSAKSSLKLNIGDKVTVFLADPTPLELLPEKIHLKIIYENKELMVIDKPSGLTVHPAPGNWNHTLVNAILAHCTELGGIGGTLRPGIVHRLDKDTSGLMVIAKNDSAQKSLSEQIKERKVVKRYIALIHGSLSPKRGAIEAPIGRDPRNRKRMAVVEGGRQARTNYEVIEYINDYTLVEASLETGRTHQIRVHFSSIGFPVVGDATYGKKSQQLDRHFLHAHVLGFNLPGSGEYVEFKSELPIDLQNMLGQLSSPLRLRNHLIA